MKKILSFFDTQFLLWSLLIFSYLNSLYKEEFRIFEITADNYSTMLTWESNSTDGLRSLDKHYPGNFELSNAHLFIENQDPNFAFKVNKNVRGDTTFVFLENNINKIGYTLFFLKQKLNTITIVGNKNPEVTNLLDKCIQDNIINNGFILMRTEKKRGFDVIVKETPTHYLVGQLPNLHDTEFGQNILIFRCYKKTRYFNSFRTYWDRKFN